jgi:hypothetical protein
MGHAMVVYHTTCHRTSCLIFFLGVGCLILVLFLVLSIPDILRQKRVSWGQALDCSKIHALVSFF